MTAYTLTYDTGTYTLDSSVGAYTLTYDTGVSTLEM